MESDSGIDILICLVLKLNISEGCDTAVLCVCGLLIPKLNVFNWSSDPCFMAVLPDLQSGYSPCSKEKYIYIQKGNDFACLV